MATTSSAQLEELLCQLGRVQNCPVPVVGCISKLSIVQHCHMPVVRCSRTVFVLQLCTCPEWEAAEQGFFSGNNVTCLQEYSVWYDKQESDLPAKCPCP